MIEPKTETVEIPEVTEPLEHQTLHNEDKVGDKSESKEDDLERSIEDGYIEDKKMKDDLKEAIIDLESDMKIGQDDVPLPEEKSEEESPLRRQGSIKQPKESVYESLNAENTDKAHQMSHVVEDHGGAIENIKKSKFQIDDLIIDDNSKIRTSQ